MTSNDEASAIRAQRLLTEAAHEFYARQPPAIGKFFALQVSTNEAVAGGEEEHRSAAARTARDSVLEVLGTRSGRGVENSELLQGAFFSVGEGGSSDPALEHSPPAVEDVQHPLLPTTPNSAAGTQALEVDSQSSAENLDEAAPSSASSAFCGLDATANLASINNREKESPRLRRRTTVSVTVVGQFMRRGTKDTYVVRWCTDAILGHCGYTAAFPAPTATRGAATEAQQFVEATMLSILQRWMLTTTTPGEHNVTVSCRNFDAYEFPTTFLAPTMPQRHARVHFGLVSVYEYHPARMEMSPTPPVCVSLPTHDGPHRRMRPPSGASRVKSRYPQEPSEDDFFVHSPGVERDSSLDNELTTTEGGAAADLRVVGADGDPQLNSDAAAVGMSATLGAWCHAPPLDGNVAEADALASQEDPLHSPSSSSGPEFPDSPVTPLTLRRGWPAMCPPAFLNLIAPSEEEDFFVHSPGGQKELALDDELGTTEGVVGADGDPQLNSEAAAVGMSTLLGWWCNAPPIDGNVAEADALASQEDPLHSPSSSSGPEFPDSPVTPLTLRRGLPAMCPPALPLRPIPTQFEVWYAASTALSPNPSVPVQSQRGKRSRSPPHRT